MTPQELLDALHAARGHLRAETPDIEAADAAITDVIDRVFEAELGATVSRVMCRFAERMAEGLYAR